MYLTLIIVNLSSLSNLTAYLIGLSLCRPSFSLSSKKSIYRMPSFVTVSYLNLKSGLAFSLSIASAMLRSVS